MNKNNVYNNGRSNFIKTFGHFNCLIIFFTIIAIYDLNNGSSLYKTQSLFLYLISSVCLNYIIDSKQKYEDIGIVFHLIPK